MRPLNVRTWSGALCAASCALAVPAWQAAAQHPAPDTPLASASLLVADSVPELRVFRDGDGVFTVQRNLGSSVTFAIDFATGRQGALMPAGGDTLRLIGMEQHRRQPTPEQVRLVTGPGSGRGARLEIREPGRSDRVATELPVRTEPLTVANGDVSLSGTLILPPGPGPFPVVVFLHGSGGATRGLFPSWAGYLASHGIAGFAYDKRGTGRSTGDWQSASLAELAEDARAVVAALRSRPHVRADAIGLVGTSQGPWIATMVAADDPRITFVVASSGGGVTPLEQEVFRRVRLVRDSGYAEADVANAERLLRRYFRYLASGGTDSVGVAALWREHSSAGWLPLVAPPADPTVGEWPPARKAFARELDFGLAALHARMRQPVLAIYGEDDTAVPVRTAVAHFRQELPRGAAGQLTAVLLPKASHGMTLPAAPGDMPRLHPEYFPRMVRWMLQQVGSVPAPR